MNYRTSALSAETLNAMLDYLSDEINNAQTKEDLLGALEIMRGMIDSPTLQNRVYGLKNIRAEVDYRAKTQTNPKLECIMQLEVPHILSETFEALSRRMRVLQAEDPDTFANATSALTWLASGAIRTS